MMGIDAQREFMLVNKHGLSYKLLVLNADSSVLQASGVNAMFILLPRYSVPKS